MADDNEPGAAEPEPMVQEPMRIDFPDITLTDDDLAGMPSLSLEEVEAMLSRPPSLPIRLRRLSYKVRGQLRDGWSVVTRACQRGLRGYADEDVWNLDSHLCQHLGQLLVASADHGRSHPDSRTREAWAVELRANGQALLAYDGTDAERVADAKEALRWAAWNLPRLWD